MSEGQRRLAAIMFTDMVGYTALGQKNESLSLALVEEQRKLIRPILSRHSGREVKTIGDAFLAEFPNALESVRCAYDIQRAIREFNFTLPEERRVHLRIGLHLGDVVESEGDISGDAVNVASRIEPLAEDGGVCISRQVYDHVQNKFELPFESIGMKALKNVNTPLEVYRLAMPWQEVRASPTVPLDKKRVAVLPFTNISPDPNDEYFADGMTEELIARLSEIEGLRVIARTSVMNFKKKDKPISEIARELEAGSIIEGSVRKAGTKVRITVQLIDADNAEHLWASNYDRELKDIFAIQSDVASRVADSLSAGVFTKRRDQDTVDIEAYTLYIRATQRAHDDTEASLREATALFERAISRDPKFARAYAGLAQTLCRLAFLGHEDMGATIPKAEQVARKAVELGPDLAETHVALAVVDGGLDKFEEEAREAKEAIRINPNLSGAHFSLGFYYSGLGKLDEGLNALRKAYELDPLSVDVGTDLALVAGVAGKEQEALQVLSKLGELDPGNPRVYFCLVHTYLQTGDYAKAEENLGVGLRISPENPQLKAIQGVLYALTDRRKEAESVLQEIRKNKSESTRLIGEVEINAALGNLDDAFKGLMRQAELHSWWFLIQTEPYLHAMRKDSRFSEFCKKVGI